MYVCAYVCMYVSKETVRCNVYFIRTYLYMCIYTHMYIYKQVLDIVTRPCLYYLRASSVLDRNAWNTHTHIYIHTYIHTYTHTYIYTHIYMHTHSGSRGCNKTASVLFASILGSGSQRLDQRHKKGCAQG